MNTVYALFIGIIITIGVLLFDFEHFWYWMLGMVCLYLGIGTILVLSFIKDDIEGYCYDVIQAFEHDPIFGVATAVWYFITDICLTNIMIAIIWPNALPDADEWKELKKIPPGTAWSALKHYCS